MRHRGLSIFFLVFFLSLTAVGNPIVVFVRGYAPVPYEMIPLQSELEQRGYQILEFRYNWRQRLRASSQELHAFLLKLYQQGNFQLRIIAHSMGGLVARHALTKDIPGAEFILVTIASPFNGFRSANGSYLWFEGLGIAPCIRDIASLSQFIRKPGKLSRSVSHFKIETLEDHQKWWNGSKWLDDHSVGLRSQIKKEIDSQALLRFRLVKGHVGVMNDGFGHVPNELTKLLDSMGLAPLPHP